jgi:hypothetical protein
MQTFKKGDKVRYVGSFRDLEALWSKEDIDQLRQVLTVDLVTEVKDNFQGVVVEEFPEYFHLNNWNVVLVSDETEMARLVLANYDSGPQKNDQIHPPV